MDSTQNCQFQNNDIVGLQCRIYDSSHTAKKTKETGNVVSSEPSFCEKQTMLNSQINRFCKIPAMLNFENKGICQRKQCWILKITPSVNIGNAEFWKSSHLLMLVLSVLNEPTER